jgi:hypothetical protein
MQDNKQNLSEGFDGKANIAKIEHNATDGLNLQQVDVSADELNRQKVEAAGPAKNNQLIDTDATEVNRQAIEVDVFGKHTESIDAEVRAQNIQVVVEQVNKRLDHFEATNFSFLQMGRAQKFTDDFVLIEEDASGVNRQLLDTSYSKMGMTVDVAQIDSGATSTLVHEAGVIPVEAGKSWGGLRLYRGDAALMARQFVFPYKQVAVALVAIVFATPIYTRPAQCRDVVGPLVMLHELADLPQVR